MTGVSGRYPSAKLSHSEFEAYPAIGISLAILLVSESNSPARLPRKILNHATLPTSGFIPSIFAAMPTLVGEDTTSDIAVIKIDADGLTPAIVGDSDKLAVGDNVLAVGNPLGELGGTVTSGIVSALNRSVSIQSSGSVNTMSLIQMDASVSPGNSGGGLFNMNGELVGIVNAKSSDSDAEGLGFAIPVNDAVKVAQELLENGYVTGRPYLGISYYAVTDAQTAAQLGVNAYGVYIVEVVKGGPADKAGLQAGDRIVSVDGSEVATQSDLGTLMQDHKAGDTIEITVARGGQMQTVNVTLGEKGAENN